jgi:magnesium chelatase subunit I
VSQRLPITVLESVVSNAERRAIANREDFVVPWVADIYASLPAITGKLELEYEGELEGGAKIARDLISLAAGETFDEHFEEEDALPIIEYFDTGGALQVAELSSAAACLKGFSTVPGLVELARTAANPDGELDETAGLVVASEVVLEGLVAKRKISRTEAGSYARRRERPRPPHGHGLGGTKWPHEM